MGTRPGLSKPANCHLRCPRHCVSTIDKVALRALSLGQPLARAAYGVTSQRRPCALVTVCLSSLAAFLPFFSLHGIYDFFFLFLIYSFMCLGGSPLVSALHLGVSFTLQDSGRKAAAGHGIGTGDPVNRASITLPLLSTVPRPPHPTLSPTKALCWQQQR